MINQTLPQYFRAEWEKMRAMPPQKRWEHFWTYYKIPTLLLALAIALLGSMISAGIESNKEVLISGVFINTDTSEEGYAYLSDGYWQYCGGEKKERVDLIQTILINLSEGELNMETADRVMQVDALIAAQQLDYMILDKSVLDFYAPQGLCLDLAQVLTAEQLERLKDKFVTAYGQEQQMEYCAAIDITDSAFAQKYGFIKKPVYFVVVCNGQNLENIPEFLDYLLSA
jgi:hypothetical protein